MMDGIEAYEADHDQIDRDHIVQDARHEKNQDSGDQRNERLDMGGSQMHLGSPRVDLELRRTAAGSTGSGEPRS